jgi:hypothetical protein
MRLLILKIIAVESFVIKSLSTLIHFIRGQSDSKTTVRYHIEGSMKLNARILHLAHMVYL